VSQLPADDGAQALIVYPGSGLGPVIDRAIVERSGGTVQAEIVEQ
jgi:hypothetical protein